MNLDRQTALYGLQRRESTIDYEGHIALLFFTKGCNLRCGYCHNPEFIPFGEEAITYGELGDILESAKENWANGVCVTGGEPCAQEEICQTAEFIKRRGFALKIDTNGMFPVRLKATLPFCDYVAMDYKAPAAKYKELAGSAAEPERAAESLRLLKESGLDYEARITLVPGFHSEDDIRLMCEELAGVKKIVLQSFAPRDNLPDVNLRTVERFSKPVLLSYAHICREYFTNVAVR